MNLIIQELDIELNEKTFDKKKKELYKIRKDNFNYLPVFQNIFNSIVIK